MKATLPRRQQGVAAIMFVIMLPVLMGFITLGVEGGRYLALKGQFRDAAEVASLAISARGSESHSENQKLAEDVLLSMIPDAKGLKVTVVRQECKSSTDCGGSTDDRRFYQYQISIASTQKSWFPDWTGDGMGFPDKMTMSMDATSRKYYGSGVDVVFVADFSGSMNSSWDNQKKITRLKKIVKDVAIKLEEYSDTLQDKNTMALVPFNYWTKQRVKKYGRWKICRVSQWKGSSESTYNALFDENKDCSFSTHEDDSSYFYTVPLSNQAQTITTAIDNMNADYGTASYEGIIRAAQIANKGTNPFRLIVVLSDGQDSPNSPNYKNRHTQLNNVNYCDKIRTTLNSQKTASGRPVQSRIAVIGIDYDAEDDPNLESCAGSDNVFTARNMDDVYDLLLNLVSNSEEVGHLYFDDA